MMTDEEKVMLGLANTVVRIFEYARMGGGTTDLLSAQGMLLMEPTRTYLANLDRVLLPLPRDGEEKRFSFPGEA